MATLEVVKNENFNLSDGPMYITSPFFWSSGASSHFVTMPLAEDATIYMTFPFFWSSGASSYFVTMPLTKDSIE